MRLIDADKMMVEETEAYASTIGKTYSITDKINYVVHTKLQMLLADAGEDIIRCRDCKHYNNGDCDEMPKLVSSDDYCSWAEKRAE